MAVLDKPNLIQIKWLDPEQSKNVEVIQPLPLTIGRDQMKNALRLNSQFVSDQHARLEWQNDQLVLVDLGSKNGTFVEGKRIQQATPLSPTTPFRIGPFIFTFNLISEVAPVRVPVAFPTHREESILLRPNEDTGLTFSPFTDALTTPTPIAGLPQDTLPALFKQQVVPIQALTKVVPVETTTYLTIGGGLGSFTWVDHLLISGADPKTMMAIGFEPKPYGRYQRLCRNSQIPGHERLRSNSDSCPDNVWGWPGYAVREMWHDVWRGRLGPALGIAWQILNEPFVQTYTPIAANVFASMDREAKRIGWGNIWRQGRVRAIRKTDDGRYVVLYSKLDDDQKNRHQLVVCQYLHLAVGYPGVRFLPDLQAYRQKTGDLRRVVNAYEMHDYVYDALKRKGGVVLIRGRGIVASRVIQRIYEIRQETDVSIGILHLMRTPLAEGNRYNESQRHVDHHWEFQPFNWPKAAWGGTLRHKLNGADDEERDSLLDAWGGTTTADREDWRHMIEQGIREGWYEIQFGNVKQVEPDGTGRIEMTLQSTSIVEREVRLQADYIIDATGLDADIDNSPLLKDLVTHYNLPRNPKRCLKVTNNFEIETLRNNTGRVYASGVSTLGGPYAPVDSFLGLQYAALCTVDDLTTAQGAPQLYRLNGIRSLMQWMRWAIGVKP